MAGVRQGKRGGGNNLVFTGIPVLASAYIASVSCSISCSFSSVFFSRQLSSIYSTATYDPNSEF